MTRTMILTLIVGCWTAWAVFPTVAPGQIVPGNSDPRIRVQPFPPPLDLQDEFSPEERINIHVYEQVNRSVVYITTRALSRDVLPFFDQVREGSGSGSILDLDGHILTNHHVIADSDDIRVTLASGDSFQAQVVGVDPANDIAVIRIEAPRELLSPVALGESSRLRVGQRVFAIGNPFGLERTMTVGIISSLNRTLPARRSQRLMKAIIQVDAALNSGNSGGPLLNSHAELIGMNTAIASPSGAGENTGVGFAIPVNTIRRVVPQLIERGRVIRPDLGIVQTWRAPEGLALAVLQPDGPAMKAGLRGIRIVVRQQRQGPFIYESRSLDFDYSDRVLAIDDQPVSTFDDLQTVVEMHDPGDTVVLTILREGARVSVPVQLGVEP